MTFLLSIPEAAAQLRIAPSTLRSPANRSRLGIDVAVTRIGRRVLINADLLREALREMAGDSAPVRQPTTKKAVI